MSDRKNEIQVELAEDRLRLAEGLLELWEQSWEDDGEDGWQTSYKHPAADDSPYYGLKITSTWDDDDVVWRIPSWKGYGFRDFLCDIIGAFETQLEALKREANRQFRWLYEIKPVNKKTPKKLLEKLHLSHGIVRATTEEDALSEVRSILRSALFTARGYSWMGQNRQTEAFGGKPVVACNFIDTDDKVVRYYIEVRRLQDVR